MCILLYGIFLILFFHSLSNRNYSSLYFSCAIYVKAIYFPRSVCQNIIWYQSLIRLFESPSDTSIDAPEALGFPIVPGIIALLPLDSVQKILSMCVAPMKCALCLSRG